MSISPFDLPIRQERTSAASTGITKPAGAASSVFDAARQAKPVRVRTPPPADIQIKSGIPLPSEGRRGVKDYYGPLIERMKPGDMVTLPRSQAQSMMARSKKLKIPMAMRALENGQAGVWRLG